MDGNDRDVFLLSQAGSLRIYTVSRNEHKAMRAQHPVLLKPLHLSFELVQMRCAEARFCLAKQGDGALLLERDAINVEFVCTSVRILHPPPLERALHYAVELLFQKPG